MNVGNFPAYCPITGIGKGEGHHQAAYRLHGGSVGIYCGRFGDTVLILLLLLERAKGV